MTCYLNEVLNAMYNSERNRPKFYADLFYDANYIVKDEHGSNTFTKYDLDIELHHKHNLPIVRNSNITNKAVDPTGEYTNYIITSVEAKNNNDSTLLIHFQTRNLIVNHSVSTGVAISEGDTVNLRVCYGHRFYIKFSFDNSSNKPYFRGLYRTNDGYSYGDYGYHHMSSSACLGTWGNTIEQLVENSEHVPFSTFMGTIINFLVHRNHNDSAGNGSGDEGYLSTIRPLNYERAQMLKNNVECGLNPFDENHVIYSWGEISQRDLIKSCQHFLASRKDIQ